MTRPRRLVPACMFLKLLLGMAQGQNQSRIKGEHSCLRFSVPCKTLGIQKVHTSSYHPQSSACRFQHTGLAHYVDAANTNWDLLVPFYLMASRATPNTTTEYSPFYLLHGREMMLPSSDDFKAKILGTTLTIIDD